MHLFETPKEAQSFSKSLTLTGKTIGFVPTMGALHDGHASLIKHAKNTCDHVVVSIFVNPLQFGPNEDFNDYPRTLKADTTVCKSLDVDAIFFPKEDTLYKAIPPLTQVHVNTLSDQFCGKSRPQFFSGVTNIVLRLFNIIQPTHAFFGEKDFQQSCIIKQLINDLFLPIELIRCPLVRESNGLALSSRNAYLSKQEVADATSIYKSLTHIKTLLNQTPELTSDMLLTEFRSTLKSTINIDYVSIVDSDTLACVTHPQKGNRVLFAGFVGQTRLIDNIEL